MDMSDIKWGIIGCGDVTEVKSGPALQKTPGSHLSMVMRRDVEKAKDYALRHGVPRWSGDAQALISDDRLDAIYIATPPSSHLDYALQALEAGKHVLLEKPMARDVAECEALIDAVARTGGKLSVAYYRRALPRFEKLREIIHDGSIGTPLMVEVRQFRKVMGGAAQTWKTDPAVGGGGYFADMQTHTLDWLTYVFGMPRTVSGWRTPPPSSGLSEDAVSFQITFDTVQATGLCYYKAQKDAESVIIHGTEGSAEMGFFRPSPIKLRRKGAAEQLDFPDPAHVHGPLIERVLTYFRDEGPNPCPANEAIAANQIMAQVLGG